MNRRNHKSRLASPDIWSGASVLITGGTGFLGGHLTHKLAGLGANVTVALEDEARPEHTAALPQEINVRDGDVRNYDALHQLVQEIAPEFIFHLAAVGVNDPFISEESALRVNLQGTINLLRAIQENKDSARPVHGGVRRVVVTGTSYEYGKHGILDPGNVYAASKVAAWAFCRMYYRAYGTPLVVARPFNTFGPGQNQRALIPSAIHAALDGEDFSTTPGEQKRDFIYIDDVIRGLLVIAEAESIEGESLDLGTGQATPVRDVVQRIFSLTQSDGLPQIGALPYRPGVVWELVADAERTRKLTGWQAGTGLEQGLKITIKALAESQSAQHASF